MSVVLKIKRSLTTATPTSLLQGELAYSELSQNLFFGSSQGVIKIGGLSDVTKLAAATANNTANTLVLRDGTGSASFQNINVEGNLTVTGDTTVVGQTVYTGDTVFEGDIFVNGGDIKSTATSFNFLPTNVTALTIGGVNTTTTFAGNVSIGGSLTVAQSATVGMDFIANTATVTGNFSVEGNTQLGNSGTDTTTIQGKTTIVTPTTMAGASPTTDAFVIKTQDNTPLFQVKENGDTVIAGVLTVNGAGTSTFAGDVAIGNSITVAENATVTMNFSANDASITGNFDVAGNTNLGNDSNDVTTVVGTLSVDGSISTSGNVTIGGNLTVNGTTTTVNSTTTTLSDPVLTLAKDTSAADAFDRGIDFKWHNGTTVKNGFFGFDDSTEKFTFIPDSTVTNGEYSGTPGTIVATRFEGLADRAERLETARTISLSGDVTGSVSFDGTQNVTISTTIQPNSVALGTDTTGDYVASVSSIDSHIIVAGTGEDAAVTIDTDATSANVNGTLVARDANGDFAARTITANLVGNASTASTLETARTISLAGDVTGSVSFDGSSNVTINTTVQPNSVALGTDTTGQYARTVAVTGNGLSINSANADDGTDYTINSNATAAATANTIVFRDSNGNTSVNSLEALAESFFKGGINGLAADGTTKTELKNFVIDGGTF